MVGRYVFPFRFRIAAAMALLAAVAAVAGTASADPGASRVATGLEVSGRGFGHGIGLSQRGAEQRALAGEDAKTILGFYYPGATLGHTPTRTIRVLLTARPSLLFGSHAPFVVRSGGAAQRFPAGLYRIDGAGRVGNRTLSFPVVVEPGAAPVQLSGTRYRGTLHLDSVSGGVRVVNALSLDDYVRGVVSSECPGYWRPAALQAQAIASRTYAVANLRPGAPFDVYPDDRSQNYHGLARELPAASSATDATRGSVLLFDGTPIDAFFSASNGGWTSSGAGLWSDAALPYLVSRPDPFDAQSPTPWGPIRLDMSRLLAAFPNLPSHIIGVSLIRDHTGRAVQLEFTGADGTVVDIDAYSFQQRFGLRSTLLSLAPTYS